MTEDISKNPALHILIDNLLNILNGKEVGIQRRGFVILVKRFKPEMLKKQNLDQKLRVPAVI